MGVLLWVNLISSSQSPDCSVVIRQDDIFFLHPQKAPQNCCHICRKVKGEWVAIGNGTKASLTHLTVAMSPIHSMTGGMSQDSNKRAPGFLVFVYEGNVHRKVGDQRQEMKMVFLK